MIERTKKVKEVVFSMYPNVFDFCIKHAVNTEENLDVKLTIRKGIATLPVHLHIIIKDNLEYVLKEE